MNKPKIFILDSLQEGFQINLRRFVAGERWIGMTAQLRRNEAACGNNN